jgi:hypothetical protein
MRRIRIANLPPEFPKQVAKQALCKYGEVYESREETQLHTYRCAVTYVPVCGF